MRYLPLTDADRRDMLASIGAPSIDALFGDVVYVELPEIGRKVAQGKEAAVVESAKAASEVYAPVSGEVVAVNDAIVEDPARVNADAMGEGWFLKLRLADPKQLDALMDDAAYQAFVAEQH